MSNDTMSEPQGRTEPAPAACAECGARDVALNWIVEGAAVCAQCRPDLATRTQMRIADALERIADSLTVERKLGEHVYSFSVASSLDTIADRLDR